MPVAHEQKFHPALPSHEGVIQEQVMMTARACNKRGEIGGGRGMRHMQAQSKVRGGCEGLGERRGAREGKRRSRITGDLEGRRGEGKRHAYGAGMLV